MHAGADPNTGRTRVSTPVLRNHAHRWDTAGQQLRSEADLAAGLAVDGVAAGPFAGFAPSYDGLVDQFRARLHQGAEATAQIADTLIRRGQRVRLARHRAPPDAAPAGRGLRDGDRYHCRGRPDPRVRRLVRNGTAEAEANTAFALRQGWVPAELADAIRAAFGDYAGTVRWLLARVDGLAAGAPRVDLLDDVAGRWSPIGDRLAATGEGLGGLLPAVAESWEGRGGTGYADVIGPQAAAAAQAGEVAGGAARATAVLAGAGRTMYLALGRRARRVRRRGERPAPWHGVGADRPGCAGGGRDRRRCPGRLRRTVRGGARPAGLGRGCGGQRADRLAHRSAWSSPAVTGRYRALGRSAEVCREFGQPAPTRGEHRSY